MIPLIERANKILIVTSANQSTADNICGALALQILLTRQGKQVTTVTQNTVSEKLYFLRGANLIQNELTESGDFVISISTENAEIDRVKYKIHDRTVDIIVSPKQGHFTPQDVTFRKNNGDFDLIITVGANELQDLGMVFAMNTEMFADLPIINISNSLENDFFGKVNIVEVSASSNCEILFDLFIKNKEYKTDIDSDLATILLAGIISETDSFREKSTTAHSLEIASQLQLIGAMQTDIIENLFKKQTLATLKVWGRILGNLEIDKNHKISWSRLTKADLEIANAQPKQVGSFTSDLLRHVKNSDLAVLFIETGEDAEIQVRTNQSNIDLRKLNIHLGSTGHKNKFGLDFIIMQKSISEIESEFMRLLVNFQKERLNIPLEVKVEKILLTPHKLPDSQNLFPKKSATIKEEIIPIAPDHIPFEAPFQPHETTGEIASTAQPQTNQDLNIPKKEEPVEQNTTKPQIPDWLHNK